MATLFHVSKMSSVYLYLSVCHLVRCCHNLLYNDKLKFLNFFPSIYFSLLQPQNRQSVYMKDQSVANVHSTSWVELVQFIRLSQ